MVGVPRAVAARLAPEIPERRHRGRRDEVVRAEPHGAALTPALAKNTWFDPDYFEPLETLAEALAHIEQDYVDRLEAACDVYNERLELLRSFVLPGGTPAAALLHVARTVVRRAERSTWAALEVHGATMNPLTATYLNRLSDLLFILARHANLEIGGDVTWKPGGDR